MTLAANVYTDSKYIIAWISLWSVKWSLVNQNDYQCKKFIKQKPGYIPDTDLSMRCKTSYILQENVNGISDIPQAKVILL